MATLNARKMSRRYSMGRVMAFASCIGVVVGSGIFLQKYRAYPHDNIPMLAKDEWSSIQGHLPLILRIRKDFVRWLYGAIKEESFPSVASLSRSPFNAQLIFAINPKHIKAIFETNFESAKKSSDLQERFRELLGDGIFR